jgi:hypothetical protein
MSKLISIPTVWTTYECEDDVIAIVGANLQAPPHILLEVLVASGKAKRINTITTSRATSVNVDDDDDDDDEKEKSPWVSSD